MKNNEIRKIHVTTHGGKLTGLKSISTSVQKNETCAKRAKNPDCICSKCYANNYLTMRKALRERLESNTEILTSEILPFELLPTINDLYFRFESFGELNNATQVINYFNICRKNPKTTFALWTKNLSMIDRAIKQGNEKPENIIIIYSSWNIGIPANIEKIRKHYNFVDKVFTVYDKNECNGVDIQCGKSKCLECLLCYTHNSVEYINEIKK